MRKITKTLASILVAGTLGLGGLTGCEYKPEFETYTVDQVFRDNSGFRTYSTREDGKVVEREFSCNSNTRLDFDFSKIPRDMSERFKFLGSSNREAVVLIRDLNENETAYANVLKYGSSVYVEVHMPKKMNLGAGIDSWSSGKTTQYGQMHEVK